MILRGLAGLLVGIGYGLIFGALTFLVFRLTGNAAHPGPMIPDNNAWLEIVIVAVTVVGAGCGALVGLIVSLFGVSKVRGTVIGTTVGLIPFLYFLSESWVAPTKLSWPDARDLLVVSVFFLLFWPVGLGLTGMVVSILASKVSGKSVRAE
jgi:hypothetical protein